MKRQYNKLICMIIALFMLTAGMCPEVPEANSFFAYIDNDSLTSCISSTKGNFSQYELSSRETIGLRDAAYVSNGSKRPVLRTILRNSSVLSLAEIFLLRISDLQHAAEMVCGSDTHYFTALLNYIHRKDGKK